MEVSKQTLDIMWMAGCAAMVMLMQGGFCLLETGLVRAKNSINVAMKNLADFCVASIAFWLVGFGLMYGASFSGLFGTSLYAFSETSNSWLVAFFVFQLVFCGTATTIVSGAIAERTRFSSYLICSVLISGFIYPVFGHWAWGGVIPGTEAGWLAKLGFIDFAGASVVHAVGGWIALASVMVIGPRLGRFGNDDEESNSKRIQGHSYPLAACGTLMLWFGWFGFNGGSTLEVTDQVPLIILNTCLSAAAGSLTGLVLSWFFEKSADVGSAINGLIAGLVVVTACCHIVQPPAALFLGVLAGATCFGGMYLLERLKVDDAIGAFPAHGIAGSLGILMVPFVADPKLLSPGLSVWQQFGVQLLGAVVCAAWAFGGGYACLVLINRFFPLRVSEADELRGLNVAEHNANTEVFSLMTEMVQHRNEGRFDRRVHVEAHTEVGQIASEYNRVLERVTEEIDSREAAYRELAKTSHYRDILENTVEGIFQTQPDGTLMSANGAMGRMLGYKNGDELLQEVSNFEILYADSQRGEEFDRLMERDGKVVDFRSELQRADGTTICVVEQVHQVTDEDSGLSYFVGSMVDISDRLETERLRDEKRAAEAASEAKSVFLANMSHEIRTPLNGVVGMIELLEGSKLTEQQSRYCQIASTSAESLLSVINDVLDFSKIEAGKLELEFNEFSLPNLLEDVADMFAPKATKKGLELVCHIAPDLPDNVMGDQERLKQVIVNLIGNAMKFTDVGSVVISANKISSQTVDGTTYSTISLEVQDSGIGIPEEKIGRLFSAFSQADSSTTRKHGGTGLGLAISKQIVELMGGQIRVSSVDGEGTRFIATLQLESVSGPASQRKSIPKQFEQIRVLAVDDTPVNCELLEEILTAWGMSIDTVPSAGAAMEALATAADKDELYQIALLDYQMPEIDGMELVRMIRANNRFDEVSLVMLTSIDFDYTEEDAREQLDDFMMKPIRQSRLFDAIANVVGQQTMGVNRPVKRRLADVDSLRSETNVESTDSAPRVLVAEDNKVNQIVIGEVLNRQNVSHCIVDDGQLAVETLQKESFDLVFMDCQMPRLDGFEATKKIRDLEANGEVFTRNGSERIPVIALTANAVKGDREQCIKAGMDEYLSKPVGSKKVASIIAEWAKPPAASTEEKSEKEPTSYQPLQSDNDTHSANGTEFDADLDLEKEQELANEPAPAQPGKVAQAPADGNGLNSEVPAIDTEKLLERCGGDGEFMLELLDIFRVETLRISDELKSAALQNDSLVVRELAHSLKGTAASSSADGLADVANELEQAAKANEDVLPMLPRLEVEMERAIAEVQVHLSELATLD